MKKFEELAPKWHNIFQEILKEDKEPERLKDCSNFGTCPIHECIENNYNIEESNYWAKHIPKCEECRRIGGIDIITAMSEHRKLSHMRIKYIKAFYEQIVPQIERHFNDEDKHVRI